MEKSVRITVILCLIISSTCLYILHKTTLIENSNTTLNVVCTTSIITDAVRIIGGEHITVHGLMGPGIDPHIYHATEQDVHTLAAADIIIYNGLHLEGKMASILHNLNSYTTAIAITDALEKEDLVESPDFPENYDPHVWFDIPLWIKIVEYIGATLQKHDPAHTQEYQNNTARYRTELEQLHAYCLARANTLTHQQRILVTAHDAFSYFGRRYGFTVAGLQGISTESEASPADIHHLVSFVIANRIPAIFVESSIPWRTLRAVQHALQARNWTITIDPELYSDALGTPGTLTGTYVGMIKHNIDSIVNALSA